MAGGARLALTDEFWRAYRDAAGLDHDNYEVVAFGDGADMATELAELTVAGIKHMQDEIETVFERFEIVWPPEIADQRLPGAGRLAIELPSIRLLTCEAGPRGGPAQLPANFIGRTGGLP
jgi:hypothetical protein